jgi:GNAT superfamily N-acetyltransferase
MQYRLATTADAPLLSRMNQRLIRDEGHRNAMSVAELRARMERWLGGEYEAVLFSDATGPAGYALFKRDEDYIYLRLFFVEPDRRRQGIGREAMASLMENAWKGTPRIRLEVLVGNSTGIAFWRSLGFVGYCVTMERDGTAM